MVGVVIGRFQVHEVHSGHLALLNWVAQRHTKMLLLLGVLPSPATQKNPLEYRIREQMLRLLFPEAVILPVIDIPEDDVAWSKQVDRLVNTAYPMQAATLYGGRDSFVKHYSGRFPTRELDLGTDVSATAIRTALADQPINTPDFRAGIIYGIANLPPRTYWTVDVGLVRVDPEASLGWQLWLGKRAHETGYRLPGGHIDPADENAQVAARRELLEETGVSVEGALQLLGDFRVDDWRTRGQPDAMYRTLLFLAPFSFGTATPKDDLDEGGWFPFSALPRIQPEHAALVAAVRQAVAA